jgi:aspartate ammonia-lyase
VIGRLDAVPEAYAEGVLSHLRRVTGDQGWRRTDNLAASYQSCDDMAAASAQLATAARAIAKLAKDLRLLASGPEAGIGELRLPAVQPGSSVMPGKVNPVIPEFAVQLALQVTGLDGAVAATVDHAELDLDVWESLAVTNLLDELSLLAAAADALTDRAVLGIEVDEKRSRAHADTLIPLLTRLARRHGYAAIADVCRRAAGDRARIAELLDAEGLVEPTE